MGNLLGTFQWYDYNADDTEKARAFYSEVIGWKVKPWEESGDEPYMMFMNGDTAIAGVMDLPGQARAMGAPPHWMAYIGTPDIAATVTKAKELGATVLLDVMEIPKVGKIAVFSDPQGAVFSAYEPLEYDEEAKPDGQIPGTIGWHELLTTDAEAAWTFYSDLFDWKKTDSMKMDGGVYQMYGQGEQTYGGFFTKSPDMPGPPTWLYYINVDNADSAIERAKANGGQLINGPLEVPGGSFVAQFMDSQGGAFAIVGPGND